MTAGALPGFPGGWPGAIQSHLLAHRGLPANIVLCRRHVSDPIGFSRAACAFRLRLSVSGRTASTRRAVIS
jgi:hypothetical protein